MTATTPQWKIKEWNGVREEVASAAATAAAAAAG